MAQQPVTKGQQFWQNLLGIVGEEGIKTELKITLTFQTLIRLLMTMVLAMLITWMIITALQRAIGNKPN